MEAGEAVCLGLVILKLRKSIYASANIGSRLAYIYILIVTRRRPL